MKTHYLKMTALSPIHIGNGEDYEPTNFIIDDGVLYEFDEIDFYRELTSTDQRAFNGIVSQNSRDILIKVHSFIKKHKEEAKRVAKNIVDVSAGIANDYDKKIGKVVQKEGGNGRGVNKNVFNQFQIQRSQRLDNAGVLYIPGSSVKGAISTAYQEQVFQKNRNEWEKEFKKVNPTMSTFKNFLVSDLQPIDANAEIGYSVNKERFEDDDQGPTNKLEVIMPGSSFVCTISQKELEPKLYADIKDIAKVCNHHYGANLQTIVQHEDMIGKYLAAGFLKECNSLSLSEKTFLLRVGRHSGARAVTIDGMREIRIKVSGGGKNRKPNVWETKDEETTTWLFAEHEMDNVNLLPFGWVKCELIEKDEYQLAVESYKLLLGRQQEKIDAIRKSYREAKEQKLHEAREAEICKQAEVERLAKEKAEEEKKLAAMTPVDKLIYSYEDISVLINEMKAGVIEDFESIKVELARKIKTELQKDPSKWEKAKKKALTRRVYIESLL